MHICRQSTFDPNGHGIEWERLLPGIDAPSPARTTRTCHGPHRGGKIND
jgi:hypothetical protein